MFAATPEAASQLDSAGVAFWLSVAAVTWVLVVRARRRRRRRRSAVLAGPRAGVRWAQRVARPLLHPRDARRDFDPDERRLIFARAGNRCEWLDGWQRCTLTIELEADHVIPHSRGGPTHVDNGQALCGPHNRHKGGRMPTRWYLRRLAAVRAQYFDGPVPRPGRRHAWQRRDLAGPVVEGAYDGPLDLGEIPPDEGLTF